MVTSPRNNARHTKTRKNARHRHTKTRKNAADAQSVYNRKRRIREAAALEKTSVIDRTGENIQKVYGHPVWGKIAGIATVLLLGFLATKSGEAIGKYTSVKQKTVDKALDTLRLTQKILDSPAGLSDLFHHLYKTLNEGIESGSDQASSEPVSTPESTLKSLADNLNKAVTDNNMIITLTYDEEKNVIQYQLVNRNEISSTEETSTYSDANKTRDLQSLFKLFSQFTPKKLQGFIDRYPGLSLDLVTHSTGSPINQNPAPTASNILEKLSMIDTDHLIILENIMEEDPNLTNDQILMIAIKLLWRDTLKYNDSDHNMMTALEIAKHSMDQGNESDESDHVGYSPPSSTDGMSRGHQDISSSTSRFVQQVGINQYGTNIIAK